MIEKMTELRAFLASLPPGPVAGPAEEAGLKRRLAAWNWLEGGEDPGMAAWKVVRADTLTWAPPVVTFVIERHRATVWGSTWAEPQQWFMDVQTGRAGW